ncbi:MAG: hypothetical protein MUE54_03905 [Anaerolineae bacterium]|nr:hypothetical protein [Anaerolineae bacterium]
MNEPDIPLSGRDDLHTKIRAQLANTPHEPLVVIGRKAVGKTTFLHGLIETAPQNAIPIFMALQTVTIDDETHFWVMFSQHILDGLNWYGLSLSDVPMNEGESGYDWFVGGFLPMVTKVLRQRYLLILWDDAHRLMTDSLPDIFIHLRGICSGYVQMVFALDTHHEDKMSQFMPFITTKHQYRLGNLSRLGCEIILRHHQPSIGNDMIDSIYAAAGGLPRLIGRYEDELGKYADIKALNHAVYVLSVDDFWGIWTSRTPDEQLVLTAIADLFYDDPLRPITTTTIAAWSAKSDYLLDETAINAALRGLLYDEIIQMSHNQIRVNGEHFRKWLLENARIGGEITPKPASNISLMLIIITLVIVGMVLVVILSVLGNNTDTTLIIPTVTPSS